MITPDIRTLAELHRRVASRLAAIPMVSTRVIQAVTMAVTAIPLAALAPGPAMVVAAMVATEATANNPERRFVT